MACEGAINHWLCGSGVFWETSDSEPWQCEKRNHNKRSLDSFYNHMNWLSVWQEFNYVSVDLVRCCRNVVSFFVAKLTCVGKRNWCRTFNTDWDLQATHSDIRGTSELFSECLTEFISVAGTALESCFPNDHKILFRCITDKLLSNDVARYELCRGTVGGTLLSV